MNKIAIKNFFKKHSFAFKIWICLLCAMFVGIRIIECVIQQNEQEKLKNYPFEVMKHEAVLSYNQYKSELVKEVKAYIDSVAPTSSLNGYAIVDCSEKYDLDIKFVLAQGQIESHFGTTGMAVKTNSVFNVGAYNNADYDTINGKFKYKHPDYSIEPYMQLLYKDYITGTKTELDLTQVRKQTNEACRGLNNLSPDEIESNLNIFIYDFQYILIYNYKKGHQ